MSNMELIKELRALTQAGMNDCKASLEEANWDLQKAVDLVKAKGLNVVSGRGGKVAADGLVMSAPAGTRGVALVEVNCQTDFVANSPTFKAFARLVAESVAQSFVNNEPFNVESVEPARVELVSTTKENVVVRRWWIQEASAPGAKVFSYTHSGKIGVLLTLLASSEDDAKDSVFRELGEDLAMQVAAMSPLAVSSEHLSPEDMERQKGIFMTQLTELKKPEATWPKILEGKFNKWFTEVTLLAQESVVHPKTTIAQVVENVGKKLSGPVQVVDFVRCQVGEGIDVKKENLADEVAKMM